MKPRDIMGGARDLASTSKVIQVSRSYKCGQNKETFDAVVSILDFTESFGGKSETVTVTCREILLHGFNAHNYDINWS